MTGVTREEAINAAAEVYGAILADPERRETLRAARARKTGPGVPVTTSREEAIQAAGEVYGAILADPERRERLRRDLAEIEACETPRAATGTDPLPMPEDVPPPAQGHRLVHSIEEVAAMLAPVVTVGWIRKHMAELPHLKSGQGSGRAGRIGFTDSHVQEIIAMLEQRPKDRQPADDDWGVRSRRGIVRPGS